MPLLLSETVRATWLPSRKTQRDPLPCPGSASTALSIRLEIARLNPSPAPRRSSRRCLCRARIDRHPSVSESQRFRDDPSTRSIADGPLALPAAASWTRLAEGAAVLLNQIFGDVAMRSPQALRSMRRVSGDMGPDGHHGDVERRKR